VAKEEIRTSSAPNPQEFCNRCALAHGQPCTARGNVYFIRAGAGRALVDTTWASHASMIRAAAKSPCGRGPPPESIVLTHVHPDHSGPDLSSPRPGTSPSRNSRCWLGEVKIRAGPDARPADAAKPESRRVGAAEAGAVRPGAARTPERRGW
jgi:glyoxylase-like metal-dependent hydrolase (beta-lactamase superfamily II)